MQTTISRKKIGITTSGNSSSNRLVTKSGIKGSPRRVGFNQELPTKRLAILIGFEDALYNIKYSRHNYFETYGHLNFYLNSPE